MYDDKELQEYRDLLKTPDHFEEGFGWRTIIGAVFIGFLMMPGSMYLQLVIGSGIGPAARWVTIILFAEIAKRSQQELKQQEIFLLYYMAGAALASPFSGLLWNQYLVQSDAAKMLGLTEFIPSWVAPQPGSESLVVAQSAILARWFKGKELALAFGIALTISRLGTLFSFNTEQLIANYFGDYRAALWAAVILCLVSFGAALVYWAMDVHGARELKLEETGADEKVNLKDVSRFPTSFWYVAVLCVTFYSAIFPFTALSTDFFHDKWGLPLQASGNGGFFEQVFANFLHMFSTAGGTTSIIIFASMVFAPFAGQLVDKIGRRATLMIFGSLLMIPAYLLMGFTTIPPRWPMIMLGAAFVLVPAAMWPSVPLIVPEELTGSAFGLITMIQNIGLALFPLLNGKLRDVTNSYTASMLMFASLGLVGLVFAVLLRRADTREGGALERP